MKKLSVVLLLFLLMTSFVMGGMEKLDPRLCRLALSHDSIPTAESPILRKSGNTTVIRAIVSVHGGVGELRNAGARLIYAHDDMAIVDISPDQLLAISDLPSVKYMEAPTVSTSLLDESAVAIEAIRARQQRGATGREIIIGIVDSGIDWRHDDFRHPDGSTRIKYILDLSEAGPVYTGTVYRENQINAALNNAAMVNQIDVSGHGTHVAGIAASDGAIGNGYGDYAGIAPEADIVAVKATRDAEGREFFTDDQIFALAFIDSVAAVLGKPWVANLSLGGHSGGHDGTSVVERYIDKITGPGISGKVVVTVAGNDGDMDIHAKASIASSSNKPIISFSIDPYVANAGTGNDMVVFSGWYDGDRKIGVALISPAGERYGPVLPSQVFPNDGSAGQRTDEGTIYMWNGFYATGSEYQAGANPYNGDREFYLQISDDDAIVPASGEWQIEFSGTGGNIDMWISNMTMTAYFEQGKVDDGKLAIPGTAKNSITAGSFISKKSWEDLDGNRLTFDSQGAFQAGDLSIFSSPGPVRKGDYQKPDITAPGQIIASTLSRNALPNSPNSIFASGNPSYPNALVNRDGYHGMNSGTSMAAPHVAGAVALILEQYPELTAIQVRSLLHNSADADNFVGATPNNYWGWGKLNVYDALLLDPEDETPTVLTLSPPAPNPFSGSTRISFELPIVENIQTTQIVIYNAFGQKVRTLVNEVKTSGVHDVYWDGRNYSGKLVSSGVYFVRMSFGRSKQVKKIVFLGSEN